MKIGIRTKPPESGSVLAVTLCVALVIGVTLTSFLILVETQRKSVGRSQTWNNVMVVTEAGVEDALEMINIKAATPELQSWTNDCIANNWDVNGNVYHARRYLDTDQTIYYDVYITNQDSAPVIYSIGHVPASYVMSAPQSFFAAAGVSTASTLGRSVGVITVRDPMFDFALAAKNRIDMNGNNVATDSFDSSKPGVYSDSSGYYDSSRNRDNGDVVSNNTITNSVISVGNADIMGHAKTGPNGTISIGSNGSVGSKDWVNNSANRGKAQDGWTSSDMNVDFPDVKSPNVTYDSPTWYTAIPTSLNVTYSGVTFNQTITATGTSYYKVSSLGGNLYVGTNANAVVWVTGSASFSGQDQITIAPGGSLTVYVGNTSGSASSFTVSGNATINNLNQKAQNLYILGLPTCSGISLSGNGAITGVVYAPEATLTLNGGGNDHYDLVGSAMAQSVTLGGHVNVHYDEALKNTGFGRGYIPSNWAETL